ncbi:prolyl oligopeptidase family serine peptidase [uncultured Roseibium sp.]|uniref:alpha/beta hydrolase n=1 Tax=uncultured Roseibium sp. TaxID=1936171 RepID=UPI0032169F7B
MPILDGPRLSPASGGKATRLVVFLHGYGADGADLIDLSRAWAEVLPDAAFVAPDAPEPLPFEALGGRQWFALTERDMREYRMGVEAAHPVLEAFLESELDRWQVGASVLALVGFSQGAMMALHTGLRRKIAPAAILAYSGLLAGPDRLDDIQTTPPVLLVHGSEDDVVPPYHLPVSRDALAGRGVDVESHLLEKLGHSIDERGMVLGGRFLKTALSGR